MASRIGRPYAKETYPETPRGGGLAALARNYAVGPSGEVATAIPITPGVQIPWGTIDVPTNPPVIQDVPITPHVSGIVRVLGSIGVSNSDNNPHILHVDVQINGVTYPVPNAEEVTVPASVAGEEADGFIQIPIMVEVPGLTLGTQIRVQILLTALTNSVLAVTVNNSTLELQEVLPATG
jgi:hypothetical protein